MDAILGWTNVITHLGRCAEAVGPSKESLPAECLVFSPERTTYLKLLLVGSYAKNAFLPIAGSRPRRLYYLDVLTASGVSYRDTQNSPPIAGSALVTPLSGHSFEEARRGARRGFDAVHCFDDSAINLDVLRQRWNGLRAAGLPLPRCEAHLGDANVVVEKVIGRISSEDDAVHKVQDRSLSMVFVDNQAMNVSMRTIQAIQHGIRGDLLVYIPVTAVWRNIQAFSATGNNPAALDQFFGGRAWVSVNSRSEIAPLYHRIVEASTGDELQNFDPVSVRGENNEFAPAIYARKTQGLRGGRTWMGSIQSLAEACNSVDLDKMDIIINRAVRRQKDMRDFLGQA